MLRMISDGAMARAAHSIGVRVSLAVVVVVFGAGHAYGNSRSGAGGETPGDPSGLAREAGPSQSGHGDAAGTKARAAETLAELLGPLERLHARYAQRVTDARGAVIRKTSGELWAARPDRFRWRSDPPFAEMLVADGERLYLFDPDLEQVTVRPLDTRLQTTPARLLSGSVEDITAAFTVELRASEANRTIFELTPKTRDGLFQRLRLVFVDSEPRRLEVHNRLSQTSSVRLADVEINPEIAPERFEFQIPQGVDVIREDEITRPGGAGDG